MVWKVISIVCYVISGFIISGVCIVAFFEPPATEPPGISKLALIPWFFIPALIALGIGLAFARFRNWRRDAGIVFASAAGYAAVMVLTMVSVYHSKEFRELFPDIEVVNFNDYVSGISFMAVFAIAGLLLIRDSRRRAEKAVEFDRQ